MQSPSAAVSLFDAPDAIAAEPAKRNLAPSCSSSPADFSMLPVLPSGEISSIRTWTGKTALRSSWIRRLNPRDESEPTNENSDNSDDKISVVAERAERPHPLRFTGEGSERSILRDRRESMEEKLEDAQRSDRVAPTKPEALVRDLSKAKFPRNDFSSDASKQIQNKQARYDADRQSKGLAIAKETVARPCQSGFGPWIKLSSSSGLEEKPSSDAARAEPNSKHAFHSSGSGKFSRFLVDSHSCEQLGKKVQDGARETLGLGNAVQKFSPGGTQAPGKPPLPPVRTETPNRDKLGWPPRSIIQNSQASPSLPGRVDPVSRDKDIPLSARDRLDSKRTVKAVRPSMSRDVLTVTKVGDTNEEKVTRANLETGASSKDAQPSKGLPKELEANYLENRLYRSKVPATHVGDCAVTLEHHRNVSFGKAFPTVNLFSKQLSAAQGEAKLEESGAVYQPPSFPHMFKESKFFERESFEGTDGAFNGRVSSDCRQSALVQRPLGSVKVPSDAKSPQTADMLSETAANGFHSWVPNSDRGNPNLVKTARVGLPTSVSEVKGNTSKPLPKVRAISFNTSETSHGTTRSEKADVGVIESPPSPSSTASFPWELFIEAAGASKKAREQFVEVYNKARDELKNQWTSHLVSRDADKEMDHTARLMSGPGACSSDLPAVRPEVKSLESHQRVWQFQGKFKILNGGLEPRVQCFGMNEQDQLASEKKGKVNALLGKKTQGFLTIHEEGDKAGPGAETCQHVKPPGVCSFGSRLNKGNGLLGDHLGQPVNGAISRYIKDCKKQNLLPIELQFRVNSKCSQRGNVHESKDCENDFEQRSDAILRVSLKGPRQEAGKCSHVEGFQSNLVVKSYTNLASTHKDHPFLKQPARESGESDNVIDRQGGACSSLLGKRPRPVLEDGFVAGKGACATGKASADSTEEPSSSIWLQRWHPTYLNGKMLEGHTNLQSNGAEQEPVRSVTVSAIKSKKRDCHSVCDKATELKGGLRRSFAQDGMLVQKDGKEQGFELQMQPAKVILSATGMGIAATAARQVHYAQPEKKGSLAFWSGFGMPAVWKSARKDVKNT